MRTERFGVRCLGGAVLLLMALASTTPVQAADSPGLEVGLAVRDISPPLPIPLAGYAARLKAADKQDHPLLVQALALKNPTGERFVFVALDNCEVSGAFMAPVYQLLREQLKLDKGQVAVVSSHTHSAPVLEDALSGMTPATPEENQRIASYSAQLRSKLVECVGAALADCQPALLESGMGRASFAMNRRVYQGDKVVFGENPDGPADWDVPVLRVRGTNGAVRAVVFGYACHGTSVSGGGDWYVVSGDYMAYARHHLEANQPGAVAMYLTGMGADSNPSPRGHLLDARRHGLELAGAVMGVLDRPMQPVRGTFKLAYEEVPLPLAPAPTREQLDKDNQSSDAHVRQRADTYLKRLKGGQALPEAVNLPVAVVRIGNDLTFVLLGGEVVVDYSRRIKRLLADEHPWTVGYAYEVPCYIPSARIIKEGGYEPDSSLIYYGFYGPFKGEIETKLLSRVQAMSAGLRTP